MKTYTFIIGTMDDFADMDALSYYVQQGWHLNSPPETGSLNCSVIEFDAPEACDEDTVIMIGRGLAFSNDWCMDDTISFVIEGSA